MVAIPRRRDSAAPQARPETASPQRDEIDPDPLIEQMVQRLRAELGSLSATDEWGRPLAWRAVVRLALGPTLGQLRDAQTAAALADAMLPAPAPEQPLSGPSPLGLDGLGWPTTDTSYAV